jgi:hypothetical protein
MRAAGPSSGPCGEAKTPSAIGNTQMSHLTRGRQVKIATGVIVFAVLMSLRYEVESIWLRSLVAGCAAAALAWSLISTVMARKGEAWRSPRAPQSPPQ